MGYMRHHAIVVTGTDYQEAITKAHTAAAGIFPWISPLSPPTINGYRSFFVPPDGSKEGWEESDVGDAQRDAFMAYLLSTGFADGGSLFAWVEVQYGDDNRETRALRDNWTSDPDFGSAGTI